DRPRPSALSGRGAARALELPAELVNQVRDLGRQEGATLFMTLLAAFQVLLHRYSGQDDFAIGTPIAGRTRSELEGLVGLFVNTLVLRAELKGDPDFRTVLRRVRQAALAAYSHQDLPFEQVVAVLHPERDPARSPLFQALFAFQNAPVPALQSPGLVMTPLEPDSGTSKFDLALFAGESSDSGLRLEMQYSTDLFDAATIEQMLRHFRHLLEGMLAHPDQTVGTVPMLSDAERRDLLGPGIAPAFDLDGLTDDEVDDLLRRFESGLDGQNE
ncbi:MAG TPA: condensation domain-containing protein, partial [Isosphaeraceae bacterium]|nr:condensation domain-containing protein [Isosphaeraceae bacterium]